MFIRNHIMHDVCNSGCDCSNARESKTAERHTVAALNPQFMKLTLPLNVRTENPVDFRKINVVLGKTRPSPLVKANAMSSL